MALSRRSRIEERELLEHLDWLEVPQGDPVDSFRLRDGSGRFLELLRQDGHIEHWDHTRQIRRGCSHVVTVGENVREAVLYAAAGQEVRSIPLRLETDSLNVVRAD